MFWQVFLQYAQTIPDNVLLENGVQFEYFNMLSMLILCFIFSLTNLIPGETFGGFSNLFISDIALKETFSGVLLRLFGFLSVKKNFVNIGFEVKIRNTFVIKRQLFHSSLIHS